MFVKYSLRNSFFKFYKATFNQSDYFLVNISLRIFHKKMIKATACSLSEKYP